MERRHPLAKCEECTLLKKENTYVPSEGPDTASIVLVGEAPGYKEARAGKPFSGPSGQLLDTVLAHHNIDRELAFITNVCLCRPPDNRTPTKSEIACCAPRLKAEIEQREPEVIVALGNTAAAAIMGHPVKITTFRAGLPKRSDLYPAADIIPTFHPAACLRSSDSFPSLVTDIGKIKNKSIGEWQPPQYKVFDNSTAARALDELVNNKALLDIVIDIETSEDKDSSYIHPSQHRLLCVGIGYAKGKAIIVTETALKIKIVWAALQRLLTSKRIIAHNGKFDLQGLWRLAQVPLYFDTMLASYALDERPGVHRLKYLAVERLGAPQYDLEIAQYIKGNKDYSNIPPEILYKYNAYDVACTWDLYEIFSRELEADDLRRLHDFLVEASNALIHCELEGVKVNLELLDDLEEKYHTELIEAEKGLYPWVDNPRSVPQVKRALEEMNIVVDSTNRETLEFLVENHAKAGSPTEDFLNRMLSYRKEQKLYSTYIKGLRKRLYNDRVFPTFMLHSTTTGRLSCRKPNLQNIPRGSTIKNLFVPDEGNVFIQADYSQIEYRIVATLAQEDYLANIFNDPSRDIFWELTYSVFGPDANKHHRQIMKRVVHGSNYGMGAETMAKQINADASQFGVAVRVTPEEAARYQRQYFSVIPKVVRWQKKVAHSILRENEDLTTDFGRRRRFWLITKDNKHEVEKEGLAFKPQSLASDICLYALIQLRLKHGLNVRIPVHDSIMVECPVERVEEVSKLMEQEMLDAATKFSTYCRFAVEIQTGSAWGELT